MKKEKMIKEIVVQVIAALVIQLLLYGIVYIYSFFNKEKINVTICASTKNDDEYITCINFKNYQNDRSINSIVVWSSANIDIDFSLLNYKEIEKQDNKIIIKNIPPSYDGTIIVKSKEEINEKNTKFEADEKKTISFLCDQKEEITQYWKQLILSVITYIIIYSIITIISKTYEEKQLELYMEENKQIKDVSAHLEKQIKDEKEQIKQLDERCSRIKICLHRKLADYSKELNFYKNIIRNAMDNDENKRDICYEVTKELKTFRTLEKIDLKDLEIDALKLSDVERDEKTNKKDNII